MIPEKSFLGQEQILFYKQFEINGRPLCCLQVCVICVVCILRLTVVFNSYEIILLIKIKICDQVVLTKSTNIGSLQIDDSTVSLQSLMFRVQRCVIILNFECIYQILYVLGN